MPVKNALFAAMALAAAGCGQPKSSVSQPVAKINGQVITSGDLDKEVGSQLQQLDDQYQKQVYQTKRQALEGMVQKRVFEAKAKQAGLASPEELIQKEVASKIPDPSDAEIQSLYDRAKASGQQLPPIEQVKPDIVRFIKQQKMQGDMMAYYENLKKEQKVEMLLPAFLPPKKDVEAKGPTKGPKNAPITIVEFSDYQCPFCIQAEKTVEDVLAAYPGKIRLVYRDFPLPMHPLAPKAAEASHCADSQGKYWEMHDKMFGAQGKLEVDNLKKYAREVGLDGDKFDKCLDSGDMAKVVDEHHKAGEKLGVSGTPAFFVNGRFLNGAQPIDEFKSLIDAELGPVAKK
jgi:protein-disulfide isomerase